MADIDDVKKINIIIQIKYYNILLLYTDNLIKIIIIFLNCIRESNVFNI